MIPDPRTALVVSLLGVAAGLASWRGALVALAALGLEAVLADVSPRTLALRLLPLASGFALFLLFLPVAPGPVLDVGLRGLAVSTATVVLGVVVSWSGVIAVLQDLGLPRPATAFLVILGRHRPGSPRTPARPTTRWSRAAATTVRGVRPLDRRPPRARARPGPPPRRPRGPRARAARVPGPRPRPAPLPPRAGEAAHYALALLLGGATVYEAGPWSR